MCNVSQFIKLSKEILQQSLLMAQFSSPNQGQLFLKAIHASVWVGQKHLGQLAKHKRA
jgi:hypothetical protein